MRPDFLETLDLAEHRSRQPRLSIGSLHDFRYVLLGNAVHVHALAMQRVAVEQ